MGWKDELERWLSGNIHPTEEWADVQRWLENDPIWTDKVRWNNRGSHRCVVRVPLMGQIRTKWKNDTLDVSTASGGTKVNKWIVAELVEAYTQLKDCE